MSNPNLHKLLNLTSNEAKVFDVLCKSRLDSKSESKHTPLSISASTKIARPTVYITLDALRGRGLINRYTLDGRKYWRVNGDSEIVELLQNSKKFLLATPSGTESYTGLKNLHNSNNLKKSNDVDALESIVKVYRGKEEIKSLINHLFTNHKHERWQAIQGNKVSPGWYQIFGLDGINHVNGLIKENQMITEGIMPHRWYKEEFDKYGISWAEGFMGRMAATSEIDQKYFDHNGQIFLFEDSAYLLALNEELVIEIKNSQIKSVLKEMMHYITDNADKVDVNSELRRLIDKEKENIKI